MVTSRAPRGPQRAHHGGKMLRMSAASNGLGETVFPANNRSEEPSAGRTVSDRMPSACTELPTNKRSQNSTHTRHRFSECSTGAHEAQRNSGYPWHYRRGHVQFLKPRVPHMSRVSPNGAERLDL